MTPCEACGCHVRQADAECPSCGAKTRTSTFRSATAAAMLIGLVACTGATTGDKTDHSGHSTTPQPEYGATMTDTDTTDMHSTDGMTDMMHETGGSGGGHTGY